MRRGSSAAGPLAMKAIDSARNAASGLLSWLVPFLLALVVTPAVVHSLGAELYGVYALVVGLGAYTLGLTPAQAVIREVAAYRARGHEGRLGSVVSAAMLLTSTIGLLLAVGLGLGADWVATAVLEVAPGSRPAAVASLRIFAIGIPLAMSSQVLSAVPQGLQRLDLYGRVVVAVAVVLLGGNLALAYAGAGLAAFVAWSVSATAIGCGVFLVVAQRLLPGALFARPPRLPELVPLARFGVTVSARQTVANLLLLFERVWIVRTLGAAALTFYAIPMLVTVSLHAFIASSALSFYPLASDAYARGDVAGLRVAYGRALKVAAPLIALPVITLVVSGSPLLSLWMGADFAQRSAPVLALHAATFGLVALMVVPWQTADALGRPGWNAGLSLAWLLVSGVLMIWWTPRFGIVGAAAARLAGLVGVPFYAARIEAWLFGGPLWRFWGRTLALLTLAAAVSAGAQLAALRLLPPGWGLVTALGGGSLAFVAGLWIVRFFDAGERQWLRRRLAALLGRSEAS